MADAQESITRLKDKIRRHGWGITVDEHLAFVQPELAALYATWRAKADALGALPRREDLDMRSLKPYLEHLSVVERIETGLGTSRYRVRLQGSFMTEIFGHQTGKLMEDAVAAELAERWTSVQDVILEAGLPLRVVGTYRQEPMEHLVAEALAVPLGNGGEPPVSVLAATYYRSRYKNEL